MKGARRQIDTCLDSGVNLIDTANVNSGGRSEEIFGEVIKGRRIRFLLSTKVRMVGGDGPHGGGLSREPPATDEGPRRRGPQWLPASVTLCERSGPKCAGELSYGATFEAHPAGMRLSWQG